MGRETIVKSNTGLKEHLFDTLASLKLGEITNQEAMTVSKVAAQINAISKLDADVMEDKPKLELRKKS